MLSLSRNTAICIPKSQDVAHRHMTFKELRVTFLIFVDMHVQDFLRKQLLVVRGYVGEPRRQKLNTNCIFVNFSAPTRRYILAKNTGYPGKKFVFLLFEGYTELCGPHPSVAPTPSHGRPPPPPTEGYPNPKFEFVLLALA